MTRSPMVWGASLACALGGAFAGHAVGSTPVLMPSELETYYQNHESSAGFDNARTALPDHYPLVTRAGTVPVAALSDRGLYSQRRYQATIMAADYGPMENSDPVPSDQWRDDALATDIPGDGMNTQAREPADNGVEPLTLAAGPAAVEPVGKAKIVNVAAMMAMR